MTSEGVSRRTSCAAGVTVFRPDATVLRRLLETLRHAEVPIFLHIDGASGEAIEGSFLDELRADACFTVLQASTNSGIGVALNALIEAAAAADFDRIVLLDQDSDAPAELCRELNATLDSLVVQGHRIAALGPQPVATEGEVIKPPRYRRRWHGAKKTDRTIVVDYVITSGSLVPIDAWRAVGAFRADYFIDGIDTEWCLRASNRGFEARLVPSIRLPHRLGNGIVRFGPIAFPRQSETRMLSYVRNRMHMLRLPYVPSHRKLQTLVYLPLQMLVFLTREPTAPGALRRFVRAACDGWQGRLGPIAKNQF